MNTGFIHWYRTNNCFSVELDFNFRELRAFSKDGELTQTLIFSNSIDGIFDLSDLFNQDLNVGDYTYNVFFEGYGGEDYLWRKKISIKIYL